MIYSLEAALVKFNSSAATRKYFNFSRLILQPPLLLEVLYYAGWIRSNIPGRKHTDGQKVHTVITYDLILFYIYFIIKIMSRAGGISKEDPLAG